MSAQDIKCSNLYCSKVLMSNGTNCTGGHSLNINGPTTSTLQCGWCKIMTTLSPEQLRKMGITCS